MGLKAGIYTSPGPWDCGNFVGGISMKRLTPEKLSEWGFDFLNTIGDLRQRRRQRSGSPQEPYQLMAAELKKQDRDIVLNLCQYGMGEVWKWRRSGPVLANHWRPGLGNGLLWHRVQQCQSFRKYAKPGCWNDPDYLLIGYVGDPNSPGVGHKSDTHAQTSDIPTCRCGV